MIITISGKPGSGKNTVADILAKRLKLRRYSVGDFRREMARKKDMTLEQLNSLGEKEFFTDKDADDWQMDIGKTEDNFIIDGRLSFHFIPNSIKLFLDVSPEAGARRIRLDNRQDELSRDDREAIALWKRRLESDRKRYKKYYKIDCYDPKNYDFVIDTSDLDVDGVVERTLTFIIKTAKNRA